MRHSQLSSNAQQKNKNDEVNYDGLNLLVDLKSFRQKPKKNGHSFGVTW